MNLAEAKIYISYPPWATCPNICRLFGIGRDQVKDWRKMGVVLCRRQGTSVQYRCADIDRAMTQQALGYKPSVAKKATRNPT